MGLRLSVGFYRRAAAVAVALGAVVITTSCASDRSLPTPPQATLVVVPVPPTEAPTMAAPAEPSPTAVRVVPTTPPVAPTTVPTVAARPTVAPTIPPTPTAVPTPAPKGAMPSAVTIPRLGTSAEIVPLGLDADGVTLAAPSDPDTVGWYEQSAQVGVPGNAVIMGHVDWGGRLRAFGLLRELRAGDRVVIEDALGRELTFIVRDIEMVDADAPAAGIVAQAGPGEELTLITCGGTFERKTHQYLSRVVVRAVREESEGDSAALAGSL